MIEDFTLRHPPTRCPKCGKLLDSTSHIMGPGARLPKPGDFSCCMYCATILRVGENGAPIALDSEGLRELATDPECALQIARLQAGVRAFHARQARRN